MKKMKTIAGSALIAAVAIGGMAASAGSAAAAEAPQAKKKSAVGPYKCATAIPLLSEDMLLASAYLSCTGQEEANEETNVHYESRMFGIELPDKKGPAIGFSILPKAVQDDVEVPAPGDDVTLPGQDGSTDGGSTDGGSTGGGSDSGGGLPFPGLPGL